MTKKTKPPNPPPRPPLITLTDEVQKNKNTKEGNKKND